MSPSSSRTTQYRIVAAPLSLTVLLALTACGGNDAEQPATPAARIAATTLIGTTAAPARTMENLGRGVVAVRTGASSVFISWRLLGLDPAAIAFNLYRSADQGTALKLNAAPLTAGTNYMDNAAPKASAYSYFVRPVVDGVEQPASEAFPLIANGAYEPVIRIPLSPVSSLPGQGYVTKYLWVGDLDGDGEYDFVIDRLAPLNPENDDYGLGNQYLEAYKRDGTRLWQIDMGPTSRGTYNINPGAATLSIGMLDGVTVSDLNGDGKAEVILKVANGVVFGNGAVHTEVDDEKQSIAILNGMTGAPLATRAFPTNFSSRGRLATQLGIGYADGVSPSIYFWGRNRNVDKSFNDVFASWSWNGGATITENWAMPISESDGLGRQASHQMRIIDLDGDGKDEVATGNFVINSNGTLRYVLPGVVHGDRFYLGKLDASRTGLQGYGIQQNNPSGLLEYYYDATTGSILWSHSTTAGTLVDVGRGLVGDIDAAYPGYEVYSYSGLYNGPGNALTQTTLNAPWPNQMLWWDGDLLSEQLGQTVIDKWNPATASNGRVLTMYHYGCNWRGRDNPLFFGDILGDWRTEVICMNEAQTELQIFTTNIASSSRIYTMAHNPAYRNHMTIKGYMQSPLPDYYLGTGMSTPPVPNIRYADNHAMQAELAMLDGGTLAKTDNNGYHGTGYADFPVNGGGLQFNYLNGGAGGAKTIALRYANGSTATRSGILKVNGVSTAIAFPSTGGWTNWATLTINVTATAGLSNTVRIESTGQDLANIDEIALQ